MCLFVCVVDHGVNEGEPVDEQYCEQENEDQFRDSNSKDSTSIRTSRKALKTASSIPSFDACFVLVLQTQPIGLFCKTAYILTAENMVG